MQSWSIQYQIQLLRQGGLIVKWSTLIVVVINVGEAGFRE